MKTFPKSAVTTLFLACASAGYAAGGGQTDSLCIPVDGTVTSVPIVPSYPGEPCEVYNAWPSAAYPTIWLPSTPEHPSCLTLTGKGKAKFTGLSGLTIVGVASQIPGYPATATPLSVLRGSEALTIFTSNAVLTGKVRNYSGSLYTQDTGAITATGFVGQVLKIVGGSLGSDFEGATGTIAVAGQEVGGEAFYTGEVCVKRK